jgi:hypothetical protein
VEIKKFRVPERRVIILESMNAEYSFIRRVSVNWQAKSTVVKKESFDVIINKGNDTAKFWVQCSILTSVLGYMKGN